MPDVADNVGVEKVEFYVNGMLLETGTASPHVFSWDTSALPAGSYTLTTKAYDRAGNTGQSQSVTVTVGGDAVLPTLTLTAPGDHTTVSGIVAVTA